MNETFINITILNDIIEFLISILPHFKTVALFLAFCLIQIDLVLTFINGEADIFKILPIKLLKWGFFLTIITKYNWFLENMINGSIQLGNYALTGTNSTDLLVSPLSFFADLLTLMVPLFSAGGTGALALDVAGIESIPTVLMFLLVGLLLTALLMSLEMILIVVEYYLIGICAILLIPFGVFDKTKNFAMRGISAMFAQSFKILMFTLLLNFIDKQWGKMLLNGLFLNILSLGGNLLTLILLYMLIKRVSAISGALMGGTGVSSTGSSAMLAGYTMSSFGAAGGIIKSEFSKAGGFGAMMSKFGGGSGSSGENAAMAYKNTTGTGGENEDK